MIQLNVTGVACNICLYNKQTNNNNSKNVQVSWSLNGWWRWVHWSIENVTCSGTYVYIYCVCTCVCIPGMQLQIAFNYYARKKNDCLYSVSVRRSTWGLVHRQIYYPLLSPLRIFPTNSLWRELEPKK